MRVLVVEDDVRLSDILVHVLQREGYDVDAVFDGEAGLEYATSVSYDAIVVDVMMPQMNDLDMVQALCETGSHTPVLMLTALGTIPDKVAGFDHGADQYLTKPFSPRELLARLRSLIRRQSHDQQKDHLLEAGSLTLDPIAYELRCADETIALSQQESCVMELLMRNADRVLSRDQIAQGAWPHDAVVKDHSIDVYISMLRKKLAFLGAEDTIVTERGLGFRLSQKRCDHVS